MGDKREIEFEDNETEDDTKSNFRPIIRSLLKDKPIIRSEWANLSLEEQKQIIIRLEKLIQELSEELQISEKRIIQAIKLL